MNQLHEYADVPPEEELHPSQMQTVGQVLDLVQRIQDETDAADVKARAKNVGIEFIKIAMGEIPLVGGALGAADGLFAMYEAGKNEEHTWAEIEEYPILKRMKMHPDLAKHLDPITLKEVDKAYRDYLGSLGRETKVKSIRDIDIFTRDWIKDDTSGNLNVELLREYVRHQLLIERAQQEASLFSAVGEFMQTRHFDDVMDNVFRRIAPNMVRHVLEREINEDMSEFLDGAIEGRFERRGGWSHEDPSPKDHGHPGDSTDYVLGYSWGWNNADTWEGNQLPAQARKEAVETQIEEFEDQISEQMVIAALEEANERINPIKLLGKARDAIRSAVQEEGMAGGFKKGLPIALGIIVGEALDNFIIPMAFLAATGIPIPPLPVGVGEIINPIVVNMVGADVEAGELADELSWYEDEYGEASSLGPRETNELREYIRELLSEEILTLHHRTSPDKAAIIRQAGFDSKIKTSFGTEVYFSTKPDGEATGYGSELVSIEIPEQYANLDDEFPDGEQHYWVTTKNLSQFGRLTEAPTLKSKGDENYFRVELGRIGYAQGGTHLRFRDCQSDVDALEQTPEYLEAEEKWMKNAKPRTDIVRDENGEWVMAETGESTPFTPKFYDVANAWIHDEGNRGKGHGKEIYKAFIDKASEYAKRNGGVFIGAHHCTLGSGTSEAAKRVWKSITKDYTSSGDVIFIGL